MTLVVGGIFNTSTHSLQAGYLNGILSRTVLVLFQNNQVYDLNCTLYGSNHKKTWYGMQIRMIHVHLKSDQTYLVICCLKRMIIIIMYATFWLILQVVLSLTWSTHPETGLLTIRPIYSETSIAQILMALKCPASLKLKCGPLGLFCDEIT